MDHIPRTISDIAGLSGGMVIAGSAVIYAVLLHFGAGAAAFCVLTEHRAHRTGDSVLMEFVRDNSVFLVCLAITAGTVSRVVFWLSLWLVVPEASVHLVRIFFWLLAIELVFFLFQVTVGYVYFYTWNRLPSGKHIVIGRMYAISALLSMAVLNGVTSFMVTPGGWTKSQHLWHAWFNPSFPPTLSMSILSAAALAVSLVVFLAACSTKCPERKKQTVVAWSARFLLPLVLTPALAAWYFNCIPDASRALALTGGIATTGLITFSICATLWLGLCAYLRLVRESYSVSVVTGSLMALLAIAATASTELFRETIRRPYAINGLMYSTGILVSNLPHYYKDGLLARCDRSIPDTPPSSGSATIGEAVYRMQCLRCHRVAGRNGIVSLLTNRDRPSVLAALDSLDKLRGPMPPFIGSETEKHALAEYLMTLTSVNVRPHDLASGYDSVQQAFTK